MGSFLLKVKKGILWRGFKGSAIFGLGFCTHNALTIYPNKRYKDVHEYLAQLESAKKKYRATLEDGKDLGKKLDDVQQIYRARVAKLDELKKKIT